MERAEAAAACHPTSFAVTRIFTEQRRLASILQAHRFVFCLVCKLKDKFPMDVQGIDIESFILAAVLGGRLQPGARLGEMQLADLFGVSRTKVREALVRLDTRGIVTVSPRSGWYVAEPSAKEAREAFHARKIVETGLLLSTRDMTAAALAQLQRHMEAERQSLGGDDIGARTCLLGDFHIHLAGLIGNRLVADIVRDLTARTTLISMLYQPKEQAEESSHDHEEIVAALGRGDFAGAAALMSAHIDHVEAGLDLTARPDPLSGLRDALFDFASSTRRPDADAHAYPNKEKQDS